MKWHKTAESNLAKLINCFFNLIATEVTFNGNES